MSSPPVKFAAESVDEGCVMRIMCSFFLLSIVLLSEFKEGDGETISTFFSVVALIGCNLLDPVIGNPFGLADSWRLGVYKLGAAPASSLPVLLLP